MCHQINPRATRTLRTFQMQNMAVLARTITFSPSGLSHEGLINIAEEEAIQGSRERARVGPYYVALEFGGALVHVHCSNGVDVHMYIRSLLFPTAMLKCFRLLEREVGRSLFHMSLRRDDRTKEPPRKKPCLSHQASRESHKCM